MNILFLARTPDATAYYRCELPVRMMQKQGINARLEYIFQKGLPIIRGVDVAWADVIVFQRPFHAQDHELIERVKNDHPHKLIVGEFDDDYETVPDWNPGYRYVKPELENWQAIVPLFDAMTCSTNPLAKRLKSLGAKSVCVIPNAHDFGLYESLAPNDEWQITKHRVKAKGTHEIESELISQEPISLFKERHKGKTIIAWFGSQTHYMDLDWPLSDDIRAICETNRDDVIWVFVGYLMWKHLAEIPEEQVYFVPGVAGVEKYYAVLKALAPDISLCPVYPCEFNCSKSSLKVQESKMFGALPIASRFDTYMDEIDEGLLADYRFGDWRSAIESALAMPREEFSRRVERNSELVRQKYDAASRPPLYVKFFEEQLACKRSSLTPQQPSS